MRKFVLLCVLIVAAVLPVQAQTQVQWDSTRAALARSSSESAKGLARHDSLYAIWKAGQTPPQPAKTLTYDSGNNQSAAAGGLLTESIAVRVLSATGAGVDGDTILWTIASGGGSLNKSQEATYSSPNVPGRTGWSGARWTLGTSGTQQAKATHKQTGQVITFNATITGQTPIPPPIDTTTPPPIPGTDPSVTVFASNDFSGTTLGKFSTTATPPNTPCNFNGVPGQCSSDGWLENGKYKIRYQRFSTNNSIDTNRSIKWNPLSNAEHINWGDTLYVEGTWIFPSITPQERIHIDTASARAGIPTTTDDQHFKALRKLVYGNAGLNAAGDGANHFVFSIHGGVLKMNPPTKSANGVCGGGAQVYNIHTFTPATLLDKPLHFVWYWIRSSGPMVADGQFKVWMNGVLIKHQTGVCTNQNSGLRWVVDFGQQYQHNGFYHEMRLLDDVVVGRK